jgi:hypothetical protein
LELKKKEETVHNIAIRSVLGSVLPDRPEREATDLVGSRVLCPLQLCLETEAWPFRHRQEHSEQHASTPPMHCESHKVTAVWVARIVPKCTDSLRTVSHGRIGGGVDDAGTALL